MRALALSLLLLSCRGEAPADARAETCPERTINCAPFGVISCGDGFDSDGDGGCTPQLAECKEGEIATPGACHAVGVEACGEGFVRENGGCRAIVAKECDGPTIATLGADKCSPIAACGAARFPAVSGPAIYVDAAYAATDSDGSEAKPYAKLSDALAVVSATRKTVALTDGLYHFSGDLDKPVDLVGRCPEKVGIRAPKGVSGPTMTINSDVTLQTLAVADGGVRIARGSVALTKVWLHDTLGIALSAGKGTKVTMTSSVVQGATDFGVAIEGAEATLAGTEVRKTTGTALRAQPAIGAQSTLRVTSSIFSDNSSDALLTRGSVVTVEGTLIRRTGARTAVESPAIYADALFKFPPTLTVRKTVIESTAGMAIGAFDGTALIENTVVTGTTPSASGPGLGILAGVDPRTKKPSKTTIDRSLFVATEGVGIAVGGAVAEVKNTIVRDTRESKHPNSGRALRAITSLDGKIGSELKVTDCLFEKSVGTGVSVSAGNVTLDRVVIRDIAPEAAKRFGFGVAVFVDAPTPPKLLARRTLVERVRDAGMVSFGAHLDIEDSVIRGVTQRAVGAFGHGVHFTPDENGFLATGSVRRTVISDVFEVGVQVFQTDVELEGLTISGVKANALANFFGDGVSITAATIDVPWKATSVSLRASKITGVARSAVSVFNADVGVEGLLSRCNGIDIAVESVVDGHPTTLADRGGNACGCDAVSACRASAANLSPVTNRL